MKKLIFTAISFLFLLLISWSISHAIYHVDLADYSSVSGVACGPLMGTISGQSVYTYPSDRGLCFFGNADKQLISGQTSFHNRGMGTATYLNAGVTRTYYDANLDRLVTAEQDDISFHTLAGRTYYDFASDCTNYLLESQTFDTASWTKSKSFVTDQGTAPDGSETAYSFVADGSNGTHYLQQGFAEGTFTDNTMQTVSLFVEADDIDWVRFGTRERSGAFHHEYFNVTTGEISSVGGVSSAWISPYTVNGARRISVTLMNGSGGSGTSRYYLYLAEDNGDVSFQNDAAGVTIWGGQVTETAWLAPYFQTQASAIIYPSSGGDLTYAVPQGIFAETLGAELGTNIDMEAGPPDGWQNYGAVSSSGLTTAQANSGTTSWFFVDQGVDGVRTAAAAAFAVSKDDLYKISVQVYPDDGTRIRLLFSDGATVINEVIATLTQDAWNLIERYVIAQTDTATAYIMAYDSGAGTKTFVDDFSIKQVTNARTSDPASGLMPPHGTMMCWWVPLFDYDTPGIVGGGLVSVANDLNSLVRPGTDGKMYGKDGTTFAVSGAANWIAWRPYKLVVQWGVLNSNVSQFRIGVDSGSGISWGSWADFDGAFTLGTTLNFFYGGFGRSLINGPYIWNRILSTNEINLTGGSP